MKHDKAMLNKLCDNCYFGDGDYRDAMKAYAEHLNQSRIDESARIRDLVLERKHWLETIAHKNEKIAELEEQRAAFIELVAKLNTANNRLEGSGFGTK